MGKGLSGWKPLSASEPALPTQPDFREPTASLRGRTSGAVRASWMAALQGPLARGLVISLVAAVFMAWVGAFGSGSAPLLVRLAYWITTMAGGTVLGVAT